MSKKREKRERKKVESAASNREYRRVEKIKYIV